MYILIIHIYIYIVAEHNTKYTAEFTTHLNFILKHIIASLALFLAPAMNTRRTMAIVKALTANKDINVHSTEAGFNKYL